MEIKIDLKGLPENITLKEIKEIEDQIIEIAKIKVFGKRKNKGEKSFSNSDFFSPIDNKDILEEIGLENER